MTKVSGVTGTEIAEVYVVNIYLPNHVAMPGCHVTKAKSLFGDSEILIGMNVINKGDFVVSNKGGVTWFTFRIPSIARIDFVDEFNKAVTKTSSSQKKKMPRPKRKRPRKRRK